MARKVFPASILTSPVDMAGSHWQEGRRIAGDGDVEVQAAVASAATSSSTVAEGLHRMESASAVQAGVGAKVHHTSVDSAGTDANGLSMSAPTTTAAAAAAAAVLADVSVAPPVGAMTAAPLAAAAMPGKHALEQSSRMVMVAGERTGRGARLGRWLRRRRSRGRDDSDVFL